MDHFRILYTTNSEQYIAASALIANDTQHKMWIATSTSSSQKHHPLHFLKSPFKSAKCPSPSPFIGNPPYILVFS